MIFIYLLGDSGYLLQPWLMTPYPLVLEGSRESLYNDVHSQARSIVERTIGIWKARWRCISSECKMRFAPEKIASIINVSAALHNICREYNITWNKPEPSDVGFHVDDVRQSNMNEIASTTSNNILNNKAKTIRDSIKNIL